MTEPQPIKLPPKTNAMLAALYQARQQAAKEFQQATNVAMEFLGVEGDHTIDFATGIVTPAATPQTTDA